MSPLHLHHELAALHFDLLFFHSLASFLHLIDLFLVTTLLSLPLFPFLVCDASHDFHRFLLLFLLFFDLSLVMIFDFLLVCLSLLLNKALLQPVFESLVTLFSFDLLMKALSFFLTELLLLSKGFTYELLLLPFVHAMSPLLVLLVQSSLLHNHLFKEISLSFEDEHLAKTLLMLLNAKPVVMADLKFGNFLLIMTMHVQH